MSSHGLVVVCDIQKAGMIFCIETLNNDPFFSLVSFHFPEKNEQVLISVYPKGLLINDVHNF